MRTFGAIAVCVIGLIASVIPQAVSSHPFWGVSGFVDKLLFEDANTQGVVLVKIDSDSPASMAGLRENDRLISLNGTAVTFSNLRMLMTQISAGETVALTVRRDEKDVELTTTAPHKSLDALVCFDWQFVAAPVFLLVLILMIATEPLDPPLWRAIILIVAGLAVVATTLIIELVAYIPWTAIWRIRSIGNRPSQSIHVTLLLIVLFTSFTLAIQGAFSVRTFIQKRMARKVAPLIPSQ